MYYNKNYGKPKSNAISIFSWIAVILVVCALCGLIPNLFNHKDGDYKRIYTDWTVGSLSEEGKFDSEVEDTMVSNRIKIEGGIKINPDFNSGITFDVYYYDDNDNFLSCTADNDSIVTVAEVENEATYIRILAHPIDKNNVINVVEKLKYANMLEIFRAPLEEDSSTEE